MSRQPTAIFLLLIAVCSSGAAAELELRFLDVGQGDAVLIRNDAKTVLVDTGPSDAIVDKLRRLGVRSLDLLLISHNHFDHFGGADQILAEMPVRHYMDNGFPTKTKIQGIVLDLVDAKGVTYLEASNRTIDMGDAHLRIIPPAENVGGDEQNNTSIGVIVERGKFKALLTGDSEVEEIKYWLAGSAIPDVDVLKAAHHGSRNGLTPLWLHRTKPEVVVISVSGDNNYGHPHPMALRYYQTKGRRVLRTDLNGDVVVMVKADGAYRISTERAAPAMSLPTTAPSPRRNCCRVCRKGQACGDGCIPKDRTCSKPAGCACDG